MGQIFLDIEIVGTRKSKTLLALFDSGAYRNYLRSKNIFDNETPDDIGFHTYEGTRESNLADGRPVVVDWVRFKELHIPQITIKDPLFLVMENLNWDVIIGAELMQKEGIVLDPPNERIIVKPDSRLF